MALKKRGYVSRAKKNLQRQLDLEHIINHTSVFDVKEIGDADLDGRTVNRIKQRFSGYFNSWVVEDLEILLR